MTLPGAGAARFHAGRECPQRGVILIRGAVHHAFPLIPGFYAEHFLCGVVPVLKPVFQTYELSHLFHVST